jgi:type IV pilus assembly protein PilB
VHYTPAEIEDWGLDPVEDGTRTFYDPGGCEDCQGTGYRGRSAIAELVEITDPIRALILERRPATEIYAAARADGTSLLRDAALAKGRAGITSLTEINRVTYGD